MAKISVFLNASLSRVDVKFLIDENAAYRKPSKKKKKRKDMSMDVFLIGK